MKISFEAKRLFNNFTGLGNYARTLVANLQSHHPDNEYILYTPRSRDTGDTHYFFDTSRFAITTPRSKKLSSLWRSWGVISNIKSDGVDIYHGLSHDLPFSVSAKRKENTRYVVTVHDVCFRTFPEMFAPIERMIYRRKYTHSLKVADAVVAISESTRRDILTFFPWVDPAKVTTIYQSLNPVYYTPMALETATEIVAKYGIHGRYMLYVGSINSRKNLLGIVKAYALISPEKRLPLVIIGTGGKYKDQVLDFASRNDISQYLHFMDNITLVSTLHAFYTAAAALVYPSFYEGFGLPVAEALLSGIPVITSTVSSLPEAAGDGALFVDPHSPEEIARAIELLSHNEAYAQELAARGKRYVEENFNIEKLTSQMMALYKSLVDKN
ncbi:MAG: glycosyltransferase family 1 protein [Rikenellaceae bacterium]